MDAVLIMPKLLWNPSIHKSELPTRKAIALSIRTVGLTAQQRSIRVEVC